METEDSNPDLVEHACNLRQIDPVQSFHELQLLAKQGVPRAMLELGRSFFLGSGTNIDYTRAEQWYRRAYEAESEHVKAMATFYLGLLYLTQGSNAKALEILSQGANLDYPPSLFYLGLAYKKGRGVRKQRVLAKELLERAAAGGHIWAMRELSHMLLCGRFGVAGFFAGLALLWRVYKDARTLQDVDPLFGTRRLDDCMIYERYREYVGERRAQ